MNQTQKTHQQSQSSHYQKESLFKNYNNYLNNTTTTANQLASQLHQQNTQMSQQQQQQQQFAQQNPQIIQQNYHQQQNSQQLSKSTIQTLEKLRNVRSLTPDKQQFMLNTQQIMNKTQQQTFQQQNNINSGSLTDRTGQNGNTSNIITVLNDNNNNNVQFNQNQTSPQGPKNNNNQQQNHNNNKLNMSNASAKNNSNHTNISNLIAANNGSAHNSKFGSKKYSISSNSGLGLTQSFNNANNKSRLNSSRVSQSKSIGPIISQSQQKPSNQILQQAFYQQQQFNQLTANTVNVSMLAANSNQIKQQSMIGTSRNSAINNNIINSDSINTTGQIILHHQGSDPSNPHLNMSIDNLSTLRSSDVNEREKNLMEKIKYYKKENQKLITLMRESETSVVERINKQKRETEQILKILNNLWPVMQKIILQTSSSDKSQVQQSHQIDQQTKETLLALGEMLGKDTKLIENSLSLTKSGQNKTSNNSSFTQLNYIDNSSTITHAQQLLMRENDSYKNELSRVKNELILQKKAQQFQQMKNEFIMQEMFKMIEESERLSETMVIKDIYDRGNSLNGDMPCSLSKIISIEAQLDEQLIVYDMQEEVDKPKLTQFLEKIQIFEKEYMKSIEQESINTPIRSLFTQEATTVSNLGLSPTPKKDLQFDTEITLINNSSNYLVKNQDTVVAPGGGSNTNNNNMNSKVQYINISQFNQNNQQQHNVKQNQVTKPSTTILTARKTGGEIMNNKVVNSSMITVTTLNQQQQHQPLQDNISLPDISSTEIAPNKMSAPNKIINFNHARGLHAYQKQQSTNHSMIQNNPHTIIQNNNGNTSNNYINIQGSVYGQIQELGGVINNNDHNDNMTINNNGSFIGNGSNNQINMKNNLAILRNRSTSPTIIPKKNLIKKDFI